MMHDMPQVTLYQKKLTYLICYRWVKRHEESVKLKGVYFWEEIQVCFPVVLRYLTSSVYEIVLRKSIPCKVKNRFFVYLFLYDSHLIE